MIERKRRKTFLNIIFNNNLSKKKTKNNNIISTTRSDWSRETATFLNLSCSVSKNPLLWSCISEEQWNLHSDVQSLCSPSVLSEIHRCNCFQREKLSSLGVDEVWDYDSGNWLGNKLSVTYAFWSTSTWGPVWRAGVQIRTRPWWTPLNPDGSHVLLWEKNIKWDKIALVFSLLG